ncbi:MAG TPA: hypothetical protein VHC69_26240 [Polyangiaceae bacterium]|nr:hypothetical protein [Polyangiaceae bacterium]
MSLIAILETSLSGSLFDEELALEIGCSNQYFFTLRVDVQPMSAQAVGKVQRRNRCRQGAGTAPEVADTFFASTALTPTADPIQRRTSRTTPVVGGATLPRRCVPRVHKPQTICRIIVLA